MYEHCRKIYNSFVRALVTVERKRETLASFSDLFCSACMYILSNIFYWKNVICLYILLETTLCEKVCQWLAISRWFFPGTPVSSTNKTDHYDITEILLKVALNTINQTKLSVLELFVLSIILYHCYCAGRWNKHGHHGKFRMELKCNQYDVMDVDVLLTYSTTIKRSTFETDTGRP